MGDVEFELTSPDSDAVVDLVPVDVDKIPPSEVPSHADLVQQVKDGKWGGGSSLKTRLTSHGHDAEAILAEVAKLK